MPRILIVDDSKVALAIVQTYLAELRPTFDVASSAEAALAQVAKESPDIVVSDVMMAGMTGVELARRVKAMSHGRVKVVLISGAAKDVADDAVRRGVAEAYLPKPLDGELLCETVAGLLGVSRRSSGHTLRPAGVRHRPVRLVLADDTLVGRKLLERVVSCDEIELVAVATSATDAARKARDLDSDVVLLDTGLLGRGATEILAGMNRAGARVCLVADRDDDGSGVFAGLAAGALDVVVRPDFAESSGPAATSIRERLVGIGRLPRRGGHRAAEPTDPRRSRSRRSTRLVVLCGGLGALAVIAQLAPRLRELVAKVPTLAAIPLPDRLDRAFAGWLTTTTGSAARLMVDPDDLAPGALLLAPNESIPRVSRRRIDLAFRTGEAAADTVVESSAAAFGDRAAVVLLSGDERSGLAGARKLKAQGGLVLAIDPAEAPVSVLAECAVREGLADEVLGYREMVDVLMLACRDPAVS